MNKKDQLQCFSCGSVKDTKHISKMEEILDEANEILDSLDKNLKKLSKIQPKIQELEKYYTSKQWIDDFSADEQGLLPKDLKRGVLSEDGISSMLERNKDYMEMTNGFDNQAL